MLSAFSLILRSSLCACLQSFSQWCGKVFAFFLDSCFFFVHLLKAYMTLCEKVMAT